MGDRIGVGVASYGMSGRVFHLPLLRHHEVFRVRGGVVKQAVKELRKRHPGLKLFRTFGNMQIDDEIDPVVVNMPDATQSELSSGCCSRESTPLWTNRSYEEPNRGRNWSISSEDRGGDRACFTTDAGPGGGVGTSTKYGKMPEPLDVSLREASIIGGGRLIR